MAQKKLTLIVIFLMLVFAAPHAVPLGPNGISFLSHAESSTPQESENKSYFTDLEVTTHNGEVLRFYSDILKDKVVVISFFYINCPTAQPSLIALFKLQKMLGDKLGRDVLLITISVDPERDTLEPLQNYAKKFNPQKGWIFLTGKPQNMDFINQRLGNTLHLPEGHLRFFLLGNLKTGHWMKLPESAPLIALSDGISSLSSRE